MKKEKPCMPKETADCGGRESLLSEVEPFRTIVVMIGIPGSGKTTFRRTYFSDLAVISLDLLHRRKREDAVLRDVLASGRSCVIDNTDVSRAERAKYLSTARDAGYRTVGVYMRSDTEECLARNELRSGKARIPRVGVLARAKALELPSRKEGFDRLFYVTISKNGFTISNWEEDHEKTDPRLADETI